ncbi:Imm70 family immunity protein [Dorea formicigenerans]|uniref:Imm70 family immunity protein n=1 Tax=Dorea formicigenerans TaxID=39486 RepID=UPI00241E9DBB
MTRFVQPEKIEIDANERAVNEKSPYCFFVCTTFDSFLNDLSNYFVTSDGRDLISVLSEAMNEAKEMQCDIEIDNL